MRSILLPPLVMFLTLSAPTSPIAAQVGALEVATAQATTQPSAPVNPNSTPATAADLPAITTLMLGTFSSFQQSKTDPDYRHIILHMSRIWPSRTDGIWIYVEQSVAPTPNQPEPRPYRQRIYRLFLRDDGKLVSRVLTLPGDPLAFAGAWKNPLPFNDISPDSLDTRTGCDMIFTKLAHNHFLAHTEGTGCESKLNGSTHATSTADIRPEGLHTWDQGFNEKGEQVWGATKGPYIFLRQPDDAGP